MNLSSVSVKRPVTTIMLILIVVLLGVVSSSRLPIDLFPDIEIPIAIVSTQYANVAPEEIEKLVTRPLEEVLGTVENIDTIQSMTTEGSSIVIVQFGFGTDMNFATLKMREKVDLISGFLPDGASDPMVIQIDPNSEAIIQISVSGADVATLQQYSDSVLKPGLERIQGVASVSINGGYEQYISVEVSTEKLSGYGVSLDQIAGTLAAENINLPAGSVMNGDKELLMRTVGEYQSVDEIANTTITLPTGSVIRLKDIAEVSLSNKEMASISKVNGKPAVNLAIQKQSGTNTVKVANAIREAASKFDKESSYDIKIVVDQSEYIKRSINQVAKNGIVGALLAIIVLFIFLRSFRSTIIIGLSIPISIIATFILIYFNDITLNMMTLGGLALGIGMLVDNSVVVLENIYRFVQEGYTKHDAAIQGAKEVAMAVTASTLTTIAVFLPIVFVEGITSIMFKELALTITFSLVSSLVVSLTLIPMLASKLLVVDERQGKQHRRKIKFIGQLLDRVDKAYGIIESTYRRMLKWSLKRKKLVVVFATALFILSILSMTLVGKEFIPETDEGAFIITLEPEAGTSIKDLSLVIDEVIEKIIDIESIDYIFSSTAGSSFMGFSQNTASIQGIMKPLSERNESVFDIIVEIEERIAEIPAIKATVASQSSMMMMGGSAIAIEIKGDDLDILEDISNQIVKLTKEVSGTRNVHSSLSTAIPQVEISIDRNNASRFGLTTAQVSSAVKGILDGYTATRYKLQGNEIDVIIEGDERYSESIANLNQLLIQSPMGVSVPLELIADIEIKTGPVMINRDDQSRIVTVSSDILGRDLKSVTKEIQDKVNQLSIPSGYTIDFGGQNQEMVEAFSDLGLALVLAVLLVYMIIASQFESLLTPFIIMFTAPLAFSGGLLGLFFTNRTLNITSIIGFIMLAGIVVNNAIVLIDYINTRRSRGEDRDEAILNAGPIRLRPILMTTFTTVLGLVPLALGIGEGAELQASMATVVISGLLVSTFLTLVFIPVMYVIFDNLHIKYINSNKQKNEPSSVDI